MDWKSASSYYETRLSDVLNIQHFAVDLAKLPQAEVPSKLTEILLQEAREHLTYAMSINTYSSQKLENLQLDH
ncbi:hypothetical protein, partial [Microcystis aeruginosa]